MHKKKTNDTYAYLIYFVYYTNLQSDIYLNFHIALALNELHTISSNISIKFASPLQITT